MAVVVSPFANFVSTVETTNRDRAV